MKIKVKNKKGKKNKNDKFYTAKNDLVFKAIFCDVNDTFLLKTLIEKCLNKKIEIIDLYPTEATKKNLYAKGKTLDVLVKVDNKIINIEVNSSFYDGLHRRTAGYICDKYSEAIRVSENYKDMPLVIQINITWGLPKHYPVRGIYRIIDLETKIEFIDNVIIYEFDMEKIRQEWYNGDKEKGYLAILDFDEEELKMVGKEDRYMSEVKKKVLDLNDDAEFKQFLTQEEDEKKRINTFKAIAREEGKAIGIKEGKAIGKSFGIKEANIKIAKKLLNKKMPLEDIAEITGLTVENIQKLEVTKD